MQVIAEVVDIEGASEVQIDVEVASQLQPDDEGAGKVEPDVKGANGVDVEDGTKYDSLSEEEFDIDTEFFRQSMTFSNAVEARRSVTRYNVAKEYDLKLNPNQKFIIRAKSKYDGCPFVLFISQDGRSGSWVPNTKIKDLVADAKLEMREMRLSVSIAIRKRAKKKVLTEMEGSYVMTI
ncbi:conserved hypothetical protein [Ricinus communis]|uniref:Transposase MuDR plant domain-containing protein n=1 Tax=Ricinus communis TaxID=3988 RepID=B9T7Y2_RICCO|nr:conserved hypothetical protein [Ricinus communis]